MATVLFECRIRYLCSWALVTKKRRSLVMRERHLKATGWARSVAKKSRLHADIAHATMEGYDFSCRELRDSSVKILPVASTNNQAP